MSVFPIAAVLAYMAIRGATSGLSYFMGVSQTTVSESGQPQVQQRQGLRILLSR